MRTKGMGTIRSAKQPSSVEAHLAFKASYICVANNGKPAAKLLRSALFAAIALAAMGRYAVTRYVNVALYT